MQQYFSSEELHLNGTYTFDREQAHHAGDVLHLNSEVVRLVYQGTAYFGRVYYENHQLKAHIFEKDQNSNELNADITLAMALIRREKFELVLQKACELGVKKIIPVMTERSVVHIHKEKEKKIYQRWEVILRQAAEQCKRNQIPELCNVIQINELKQHLSKLNIVPYEKASLESDYISNIYAGEKSVTVVIGPEGGFSTEEIEMLKSYGYDTVSLGSRILRAETAAIYACSILSEAVERKQKSEFYDH